MTAIVQVLRELLASRQDIELVILFGSAARGALTRSSDLDLAVRWRVQDDRDALLAAIERTVGRTVDLVDLDVAPPQLRFEIARDGVVIVDRSPGSWSKFRARAFIDWWDFAPIARLIHGARIARLREGVHGSG